MNELRKKGRKGEAKKNESGLLCTIECNTKRASAALLYEPDTEWEIWSFLLQTQQNKGEKYNAKARCWGSELIRGKIVEKAAQQRNIARAQSVKNVSVFHLNALKKEEEERKKKTLYQMVISCSWDCKFHIKYYIAHHIHTIALTDACGWAGGCVCGMEFVLKSMEKWVYALYMDIFRLNI